MSTIEEAREQAREALADFEGEVLEGQGSHAWGLADALRALLDATEPPKPAEDEREALVDVIRLFFQNWRSIGKVSAALEVSIDSLEGAVDDLIKLGEPRPITDEMIEAARRAWHDADDSTGPGTRMRAALEAAEGARR